MDSRRIAQFSSQFNQYGHLTNLTRSVSETSSAGGSLGVSASKVDKSSSEQIGQTKQFDPQWLNPLVFLDDVGRRGMVRRDISEAQIGQFVLGTGQMTINDPAILRSGWEKPAVQKLVKAGMPEAGVLAAVSGLNKTRGERRKEARSLADAQTHEFDLFLAALGMLPHAFQMRLLSPEYILWSTLEDQFIIGRSSDLIIKHGCLLGGEWNVLGILDALPYDPEYRNNEGQSESELVAATMGTAIGAVAAQIGIVARNMVGRPGNSYGVTPIIIFREVTG